MEEEVKDGERGEKESSRKRIEKGQTNNLSNIYHREFTWTKKRVLSHVKFTTQGFCITGEKDTRRCQWVPELMVSLDKRERL